MSRSASRRILALLLCLPPLGCEARSSYATEANVNESTLSCIQSYCEGPLMSHIITEVAANADFSVGLPAPDVGEAGTVWWNLILSAQQELADRTQALALAAPGVTTKTIAVPLVNGFVVNGARFVSTFYVVGNYHYFVQSTVSGGDPGKIRVPISVPPGLQIIDATLWIDNTSFGGGGVTARPAVMPSVALVRQDPSATTATTIASQADTSASNAIYEARHSVVVTTSHTVVSANAYFLDITGEDGANATAGRLQVVGLQYRVGMP